MALSGIQIFKLLPKTNCGECGVPTCLAFAMSLAASKAELSQCPYISDEAKAALSEASAPPIRTVTVGAGRGEIKLGGETVLFRHEKTFVNPPGLALLISDEYDDAEIDARLERFEQLRYERVGSELRGDMLALQCDSNDAERFVHLIERTRSADGAAFVLIAKTAELLDAGAAALAGMRPLLYAADAQNLDAVAAVAKDRGCPVAIKADNLEGVAALTAALEAQGIHDIVIDSGAADIKTAFVDQIAIRRGALLAKNKAWGYPTISFPCRTASDALDEALHAATFIAKYAGIVVLSDFRGETLLPLLLQRLNIYTDPQRPMVTEPRIYEIGAVDDSSPLLVTCNFALTYFIVSGEVEASRVPARLLVIDTEGLSVLTAWAAGKFAGDLIGQAIKKSGLAQSSSNRKVVIPGVTAVISGELEQELGDEWEVLVGPRDAPNLTPFLKQLCG
ncbi:MAG: acetyl-CoA decarbonylase/synthase complex subunit gamma [Candidatus Alcyoniella australis]|nr:acetyl-CoA decarbonylase/synthase complex subunit gamma [Candidatus Alcyoniella australis]